MAWLHDGEEISKISLFVLAQLTNVTVTQTDTPGGGIYRAYAYASRGKNCKYNFFKLISLTHMC